MVDADALVGTWRLVGVSSSTGESPYGRSPNGLLVYTPDGTMTALISHGLGNRSPSTIGPRHLPMSKRMPSQRSLPTAAGTRWATGG